MKNYGYIPEPIVIDKDYIFGGYGSLGGDILQPTGQWLAFVPQGESQRNFGFDPQGCVSWGTENAVEILLRRIYGQTDNFSDRFLAKVSETTTSGNSPQKVSEALRKKGVPYEAQWPITEDINSWDEFYADIPQPIQTMALAFTAEFSFQHEYVGTSPAQLKESLKYSPLGVAVSAWEQDGPYYVSNFPNNHWCVLVGYKDNDYWIVYDSYPESEGDYIKHLAWNYDFSVAKRYKITQQVEKLSNSWWDFLLNLFKAAWGLAGRKLGLWNG